MFLKTATTAYTESSSDSISRLKEEIETAQALVVGAGAGLSASAGFTYAGKRFEENFPDFIRKYSFKDMYTGGFYPFNSLEEHWAYWSRYIWINRYQDPPKDVYTRLLNLVSDKDYFVITTNVDHCFQKAGFDKERLFYTQGDYGLLQCSRPCHMCTYDNEDIIRKMVEAQGLVIKEHGFSPMPGASIKMSVPSELVPYCPVCKIPMSMNLRSDGTFVEDEGWHKAMNRYSKFLEAHQGMHVLFLELGVGGNTPGIIKFPFRRMTVENPRAVYACVNYGEAYASREIGERSICINGDIGEVLKELK
ncbi:MAG: SIR2 family NAD-dependent protein deacylase [Candidatus Avilachnospira sp.]|jgi:NAD-dependent SIR2 family protein deacetylase